MSEKRQVVQGTIAAAPEDVFAVLADPARHTEIDGSGMLRGAAGAGGPVAKVGDTFLMEMNQDGLGDYQMRSEIVDFEPGRRIVWAPALYPPHALRDKIGDVDASGHIWGWELEPTPTGGTRVTHIYDWSGVRDSRALPLFPRVTEEQMAASIALVADATR